MDRGEEISELLTLTPEELLAKAAGHLLVLDTLDELHEHFARSLADEIKLNNHRGDPTVLILPYGPVPQYPIFVDYVNREGISLKGCTFFFMDEYAEANGVEIDRSHHLSFRRGIEEIFSRIEAGLRIHNSRLVFPSAGNINRLKDMIANAGGVQTCYGGIGIHGHLAFNEPERGVRWTDPRLVRLNDYTVTLNCIREGVGGDLVNFPRLAFTLGMNQILGAGRIRLYCRNDIPGIDWANTVLRLAILGEPRDDYPVTFVRGHRDWMVVTDKSTASPPKQVLGRSTGK
jgi:glucosamine-6-phosphate deaminase